MIEKDEYLPLLAEVFRENGLPLSDDRAEALYLLSDRLLKANEQFNLTAIKIPRNIAVLHMADCARAAGAFPPNARVIDVGCGAGFPSLPLAILRPDLCVTALDATAKKVNFVQETATFLGLSNVKAICCRAEDAANDPAYREKFDAATARAVAALPVLCELCLPFVKVGGLFVAMKGKNAEAELAAAKGAIALLGGETLSCDTTPLFGFEEPASRAEICLRKTSPCPKGYPRPYAKILKRPL